MDISQILEAVKNQTITPQEAEKQLKYLPYEELGYAKLDAHRKIRQGFPEVVFCSGKKDEYLIEIFRHLYKENGEVLGTRATKTQYECLKAALGGDAEGGKPNLEYDEESHILKIEKEKEHIGKIVVCTAGTADIPVAKEAMQTAYYFGANVEEVYDVGVSGLHRLLGNVDRLQDANCVVAVAGMEGALASVVGGLVSCPVIAVPTSVGYGASMHGLSALLTMINSCANGISVVNIDNGYGAGYIAAQINRQSSVSR
ncbi:MAG: nickel pincer cofactor biosynthesis protein LarB [Lachnospiraceae bacterium]|nr:nickel pincer cofactor biosynthesis protein LarB [Lachnospiraceae bacterium]